MSQFGIVDVPSDRRSHNRITPRGGGLGLVLIYSVIFPIFEYFYSGSLIYTSKILQVFLPIALVSFWDDLYQLSISLRLFTHCLCSCLAAIILVQPFSLFHSELLYIDFAISAITLVAFLNLYNFLDGIDGISVSESIHLSCTILILCSLKTDLIPNVGFIIVTTTIVLGWSIGFVFFNWHPAQIFLGDVGSISLGFLQGLCLILIATASYHLLVSCAIASLYYIADGGLTIFIRLINGEKIWEPHLKHFFQKAIKNGRNHSEVVQKIIKCNLVLMLLAISALYYPIFSLILAIVIVTITLIGLSR
jgi:UDP-N-acetylmuramyl pentapeptide phosphotransferase/UDP-N-acetylglucosamine-1-phosphate transferase